MSRSDLDENGWVVHVSHSDMSLHGDICGNDGWFGFYSGSRTGFIQAMFKGSGTARLLYGNCWNKNKVSVFLNNEKISSAYGKETEVEVSFNFIAGDIIRIVEDGAIIKLHSLTISCDGKYVHSYHIEN